jgi:hypothetical protein
MTLLLGSLEGFFYVPGERHLFFGGLSGFRGFLEGGIDGEAWVVDLFRR